MYMKQFYHQNNTGCSVNMNMKPLETKVVNMLQALERHPELYKQSDPIYHKTLRVVKQKTWDQIARSSGFTKTEDAKCRWRGLLLYFRQILEDVAKKKVRRYIPNSGDPNDKYVQLTDWRYYEYIKFMEPHIKIASNLIDPRKKTKAVEDSKSSIQLQEQMQHIKQEDISTRSMTEQDSPFKKVVVLRNPKAAPMDSEITPKYLHRKVKIGKVTMDIKINSRTKKADVSMKNQHGTTTSTTLPIIMASPADEVFTAPTALSNFSSKKFEDLSSNDQNLKSFFDAMLKSAQRLPTYHQNCVKRKLLDAVRKNYFK